MTGRRDDLSNRESRKVPGLTEDHSVPYEYPAIDEKPSYWAVRWAEFKRICVSLQAARNSDNDGPLGDHDRRRTHHDVLRKLFVIN